MGKREEEVHHFPFSICHFSFGHFTESHFVVLRVDSWIVSLANEQNDPRNHERTRIESENGQMRNDK